MLEDQIKKRLERHIKHGGLITAPDELLDNVLKGVARWLKEHEREYHAAYGLSAAEALRDLRLTRLRRKQPQRIN
jgi:hypothetical protein